MTRRPRALPLGRDPSSRFVPVLLGLMVYLSALSLAVVLVFWQGTVSWRRGLDVALTVQILPDARDGSLERRSEAALAVLRAMPGVSAATPVAPERVRALLAPWLGGEGRLDELPLPRLIDVAVSDRAALDLETLRRRLVAAAPGATLEDHGAWLRPLNRLMLAVEAVAFGVTALICLGAVVTVVFATRTGMIIHAEVIEILHLIGARDSFIARQFQRHAFALGLRAGLLGFALAAVTLAGLAAAARRLDPALLPEIAFDTTQWAALCALPLFIALLVTTTARVTVMRRLRRMP